MIKTNDLLLFLFLGFTVAAFIDFNLVALGIVGLVLALLYVQLHPTFAATVSPAGTSTETPDDEF